LSRSANYRAEVAAASFWNDASQANSSE